MMKVFVATFENYKDDTFTKEIVAKDIFVARSIAEANVNKCDNEVLIFIVEKTN